MIKPRRFHLFLRDVFRVTEKCSAELELELGSPGERVSVHIEAIAVAASEQQPKRCRCVLVDLSTLRRTEHKLRESDERFRQIAECIEDVFYVREQDGRFSYVDGILRAVSSSWPTLLTSSRSS